MKNRLAIAESFNNQYSRARDSFLTNIKRKAKSLSGGKGSQALSIVRQFMELDQKYTRLGNRYPNAKIYILCDSEMPSLALRLAWSIERICERRRSEIARPAASSAPRLIRR